MRKSKKRVIAIITCCFVLAAFCVGVFADETTTDDIIDLNQTRLGTILYSDPYDLGDLVYKFDDNNDSYVINEGYYILKIKTNDVVYSSNIGLVFNNQDHADDSGVVVDTITDTYVRYYNDGTVNTNYIYVDSFDPFYVYVYFDNGHINPYGDFVTYFDYVEIYSISNRSVIDSVYSNSQDVNSSIVSVINEATNVITTNDVVMMFCILIPVISFGVGILIRLRKRA